MLRSLPSWQPLHSNADMHPVTCNKILRPLRGQMPAGRLFARWDSQEQGRKQG